MKNSVSIALLAVLFANAGVLHFVFPTAYAAVIPHWLPWPRALVVISGAAEIVGALGLLSHAWRGYAGVGLILLCIAVLPANVQMLIDAQATDASWPWQAALWIRLPLQGLLIVWIWRATRSASSAQGKY